MNFTAGRHLKHHLAWHSHFTDDETESRRLSDLSKTIQLVTVNTECLSTWETITLSPFSSLRNNSRVTRECHQSLFHPMFSSLCLFHSFGKGEYYTAIRKDGTLPFATTWTDLAVIMLSKIPKSDRRSQELYDFTHM